MNKQIKQHLNSVKNFKKLCIFFTIFLFLFVSCKNIGLGAAVDTEAPTVTINYPPSLATIRKSFIFAGTWSDDQSIKSVNVEVFRTESDESKKSVYSGTATVGDGTWQITLNNYDAEKYSSTNGWEFSDGSYEISVIAQDNAGHSSGTSSRAFTIDNTAPVLVLTKPTTVGSNTAKAYGRTVQLEGTFSEGCPSGISKLVVSFYNSTGTKLFDSSFSNITDMSNANPLTVAQYYDEDKVPASSDENYSKWENYQKLYGSDSISTYRNNGTAESEKFYFTVTASDAAKIYQNVSDSGVVSGNVTTTYYRGTTEMLNLVKSKNESFPDFTVANLRSYLNGTDTTYGGNSNLKTILSAAASNSSSTGNSASIASSISNTSTSDGDVYLTFTMNPANNPTYTISGLSIDTSTTDTDNYTDGYYNYNADSTINASVATGLDGTNLDTSTISIYYAQVDSDGKASEDKKLFWTWDYDVALSYAIAGGLDETEAKANIGTNPKHYRYTVTTDNENSDSLSVASTLTTGEIKSGNKYVFSIEGKDIDGQSIVASSSDGFGFIAKSNAKTPKISIGTASDYTNLATQSAFTNSVFEGEKFGFSGTVTSSEEIKAKSYTVTVTDSSNSSSTATTTVEFSNSSDLFTLQYGTTYDYDWSFTVSPTTEMTKLVSSGSGLYIVDVAISATNGGGKSSSSRTYYLDTMAPTISNVAVSTGYTASDGTIYLNNTKTFTLSGMSQDNRPIVKTSYTFTGVGTDGKTKNLSPIESNSNNSWSFENIDLTGFAAQDGTDITLTITATDTAGNTADTTYLIELDTTAPAGKHIYDKKNKDLVFRVGEADNELSELTAADSTITKLDDKLDKDVGGKYNYASFNNSQTLTLRGDWTEEGSGVKMIYYKIYSEKPSETDISYFLENYATLKDGYFSPSIDDDDVTKRVSYTDSDGTKKFTEITSSFKTIISGLSAGSNYIVFVAVDNVGNAGVDSLEATCVYDNSSDNVDETELLWNGEIAAVSINVDVEAPSGISNVSGTQYTNKVSEIEVTGIAEDNASGISSVVLTVNGNSVTATTGTDESDTSTSTHWKATIPTSMLSGLSSSSNPVALIVTDSAGNQNSNTAFTLQVDTESPTVDITNPEIGTATLNGKISVSGTVSYDGALPSSLALYYSLTKPTSSTTLSDLTQIGETITESSKIYSWSFSDVDVTTISKVTEDSPTGTIYLVPVVYDAAGNCNIYTESVSTSSTTTSTNSTTTGNCFAYTVDQNADRPVIKITSIDDADSWLKSATVQGTVTDDDGISSFQISENNSTWTTVSVSNGTWSYAITSGDGEGKTLYFKVTDAAGTTFTTAATSKFNRPYYLYANSTSSDENYAEYGFDNSSAISVKLDTNYPMVGNAGLDIQTSYSSLADVSSVVSTSSTTTSTGSTTTTAGVASEYEISAARYAGGDYKYIKFYVPVYDANISSVKITIADTAAGMDETSSYKPVVVSTGSTTDGTESIALTATTTSAVVSASSTSTNYTYWESGVISVADVSSTGTKTLTITASDTAGNETSVTKTFYVDNEVGEESITITSPSSDDEVTGTVNVVGTATDIGIGLKSIEWLVPPTGYGETDSTSSDYKSDADLSDLEGWTSDNNTNGIAVFNFKFLAGDKTDLVNYDDTTNYAVTYDSSEETYKIPLFIRATDKLGNIYIKRDFYLTHNPDADRPLTEISYPTESDYDSDESYITLSGTIRVNGTVEIPSGTTTVGKVYIQIGTVADDGTITWSSKNSALADEFTALGGVVTKSGLDGYSTLTYVSEDWWGIPCTTKTSTWNLSLNSNGNLNPTTDGETTNIAVRTCAINADGKMGRWTDASIIHVDSNAPSQSAVMRRYSTFSETALDSNITVQKDYLSEMYLKGTWYLTVTLSDNDSLVYKTINVKRGSASTDWYTSTKTDLSDSANGVSNTIYIPIVTTDITTSSVSYTVYVEDSAEHSSTGTYTFYIDNTAPTFDTLKGNDESLLDSTVPVVQNSNYAYTLAGSMTESGSGLERIFFYFLRQDGTDTEGSTKRVLDAVKTYSTYSSDTTDFYVSSLKSYTLTQESDTFTMYGKTYSGSLDDGRTTFTISDSSYISNVHIRKGGLIYIGGEYHKITSAESSAITFEDSIPSSISVTEAGFPYGQVVDCTEKATFDSSSNKYVITSDDGDEMPETMTKVATTYNWDGTIYSDVMPDGPCQIVLIAFDAAGNVSGKTISTSIQNNAPRIAKLHLGTDLSGDGTYSENEFNTYSFISGNAKQDLFQSSVDFETSGTAYASYGKPFKITNGLAVVPEFTGGNGDIYMKFLADASTETVYQTKSSDSDSAFYAAESDTTKVTATFSVNKNTTTGTDNTTKAFVVNDTNLTNLTDGTEKAMSFTFWDSTDGTTCGTDSNYCFVRVSDFTLALKDSVAPTTVVNPFYWNSSSDNSLYDNSTANGHIELEADLPSSFTESGSGENDRDPKVSGKVTLTGYAYDDQRLGKISVQFTDGLLSSETEVATYANGTWTVSSTTMDSDGYVFTVSTDEDDGAYFNQNGHKVFWTLSLDTEKITSVAAADVSVTVKATDAKGDNGGNVTSTTSSVTDTSDGKYNKPTYQMDIVPYIAGIKTSLSSLKKTNSSIFDRTALGHYPVASSEKIYVYGFNLSGGTLYDSATIAASASLTSATASSQSWYSSTAAPAGSVYSVGDISSFTSGNVYVQVGKIKSLNNENSNDSKGAYEGTTTGTTGDATIYENYYNRQPNDDSNNLLTDDVVLDVWSFDSDAAVPISGKIEQPQMAIDPATGQLGFAFVNGPLYFSMAGSTENSTKTSYDYWMGSFDFFTSVGFAYDSLGYTYGVAAGGDINSKEADKFQFMTSRWGTASRAQNGSYSASNSLRLESIGMTGTKADTTDTTLYYDKQRIKSPSLVTATHTNDTTTNVYLAYYDAMNDEIRFKSGNSSTFNDGAFGSYVETDNYIIIEDVDAGKVNFNGTNSIYCNVYYDLGLSNGDVVRSYNSSKTLYNETYYTVAGVGDSGGKYWFKLQSNETDQTYTNWYAGEGSYLRLCEASATNDSFQDYDTTNAPPKYRHATVSLLAGNGTNYNAGSYVSLGVIPCSTSTGDVVVAVWYDETNRVLLYSYNDTPQIDRNGTTDRSGWSAPVQVFTGDYENAGEYCQVAVDANGGVHIAAYDGSNCDLVYAYLPSGKSGKASSQSDFSTCVVDASGVVGSNLTIDVALDSSGNAIPRIGYYATSCVRPKIAYRVDTTSTAPIGSVDEAFTGYWECSVVPTSSSVSTQSNQYNKMNVGVWKDSDGKITTSKTGTSSYTNNASSYNSTSYGFVWGNGTSNPVMGYAIKVSSSTDAIETAQMQ